MSAKWKLGDDVVKSEHFSVIKKDKEGKHNNQQKKQRAAVAKQRKFVRGEKGHD